ncbi:hypothetical protein N9084_00395 [Flavobacteriales bacterium]|nr:hypothetical protein [Flavobacteriales bacterium]
MEFNRLSLAECCIQGGQDVDAVSVVAPCISVIIASVRFCASGVGAQGDVGADSQIIIVTGEGVSTGILFDLHGDYRFTLIAIHLNFDGVRLIRPWLHL